MDIFQLDYFIKVVESGGSLTLAAKKINISQSALSQLISNFEKEEGIELFYREKGRLTELTDCGQDFYAYALKITQLYNDMYEMVRRASLKKKGQLRIGIPSLILRLYFTSFFTKFIVKNNEVKIEIVEGGSKQLTSLLLKGELDLAVLIEPTFLNQDKFETFPLMSDHIGAFLNASHPLTRLKQLEWKDIEQYPVASFNQNFLSYDLIQQAMKAEKVQLEMKFTSSSWDFLMQVTKESSAIALLPTPLHYYIDDDSTMIPFKKPIPFKTSLCRPIKEDYSNLERYVKGSILTCFANRRATLSTSDESELLGI